MAQKRRAAVHEHEADTPVDKPLRHHMTFSIPESLMERIRRCAKMREIVEGKKWSYTHFLADLITKELDNIEPKLRKQAAEVIQS